MKRRNRAAIEAVARHFAATWREGEGPPDAYLVIAGKKISVDIAAIKRLTVERSNDSKLRLRFDKVALRVVRGLQAALSSSVPDGRVLMVTITAPIRQAAKTLRALAEKVRLLLARGSARGDVSDTIHGNQIRIRLAPSGVQRAATVIAFVHNPDTDPTVLLDLAQRLRESVSAATEKRARSKSAQWLVILAEDAPSDIEIFRRIHAELAIASDFKKILLVFAGGRVETLMG